MVPTLLRLQGSVEQDTREEMYAWDSEESESIGITEEVGVMLEACTT